MPVVILMHTTAASPTGVLYAGREYELPRDVAAVLVNAGAAVVVRGELYERQTATKRTTNRAVLR